MDKCRIIKEGRVIGEVEYLDDSGGYAEGVLSTRVEWLGDWEEGARAKVVMSVVGQVSVYWFDEIEQFDYEGVEDVLVAVRATMSAIVRYAEWTTHEGARTLPDGVTLEFY